MGDVEADAEHLYKAMRGLGTNDKVLIEILCNRSNEHLQHVRDAYDKKYNKPLHREIDSETSGAYQEALFGLLFTPAEYDVHCLNKAMKGTGCDEEVLLEHLTHRSSAEMAAIEAEYLRIIGRTLQHDLKTELGGDIEKFFVHLIEGTKAGGVHTWTEEEVNRDSELLYKAGAGKIGCDEGKFINILTSKGADYITKLDEIYAKHTGETLEGVIQKEFGGILQKGLLCIMTSHDDYYAKRIDVALKGIGSDDLRLVRIVCSRRPYLHGINEAHKHLNNTTLQHRIETEVGGDLKRVLVSVTVGL